MILKQLSEVIYSLYNNGRVQATNRSLSQQDIDQYTKITFGNILRRLSRSNEKMDGAPDLYSVAPILSTQKFQLPDEVSMTGLRRVDMSEFDLYRLPKNAHITNVYPIGCGQGQGQALTQVQPSEEYFYLSPDYTFFQFFVVKGQGINTYHLPPCVKSVEIEATFDYSDLSIDVSFDIAYDISTEVLGAILRLPDYVKSKDNPYTETQKILRQKLGQQQEAEV